ncbi:MAG: hypothetical protein RIQ37_412 [Actinomycetota bacterium]
MLTNQFGRVDEANNVFVNDNGTERQVGQYPNVSPEEAFAYFTKKFEDLDAQVRLLEQRVSSGASDAKNLKITRDHLAAELVEPKAVGNLNNLRERVARLEQPITEAHEKFLVEREADVAKALDEKEVIASRAEAIVSNLEKINWKKSTAEMTELFNTWQTLQKNGPKVPKAQADPIWKRFSQARAKFEAGRRTYFAKLDSQFKEAKGVKQELVTKAEALVAKGAEAANDYKKLQDLWKKAPKAGKLEDDLWKKFRAAGDIIFAAKKIADDEQSVVQKANLESKLALLVEAEKIDLTNLDEAKKALQGIQSKWEKIGHVPRTEVRNVEDRLRKIEKSIAEKQADLWRRSDPAAKARSNSLVTQLEEVIASLEAELAKAPADKKASIKAQIEARTSWLEAAKKAVD